jgi:hypothetical protein
MKSMLLCSFFIIAALAPSSSAKTKSWVNNPNIRELKLVTQLPAELPQRISSLAFDGKNIWVSIYLGRGQYATLDPSTLNWKISDSEQHHKAFREVAGAFESPGGICFVKDKLWVAGSYGESFGYIDTQDWKVTKLFKGKYRDDSASQMFASMAYDGNHIWVAWHWFRYKLPTSQTQLLLKIEPETGKVIGEYPLPAGTANDGTHGLTWDGTQLWHMKDSKLSSIDPDSGAVTAQYSLEQIKRASGLAWDGQALWIAEFNGKMWRLPF